LGLQLSFSVAFHNLSSAVAIVVAVEMNLMDYGLYSLARICIHYCRRLHAIVKKLFHTYLMEISPVFIVIILDHVLDH